jgi:effector-binding domain-containing protein
LIDTPVIITTTAQLTAVIPLVIRKDEMPKVFGPCIRELFAVVAAQKLTPAGPVFAHHFKICADSFEFELGVPILESIRPVGRVKPGLWPAMRVARTVFHGPYQGLPDAWGQFMTWVDTAGHTPAEDLWECYVVTPDSNPDPTTWQTQLNRPLLPAG